MAVSPIEFEEGLSGKSIMIIFFKNEKKGYIHKLLIYVMKKVPNLSSNLAYLWITIYFKWMDIFLNVRKLSRQ